MRRGAVAPLEPRTPVRALHLDGTAVRVIDAALPDPERDSAGMDDGKLIAELVAQVFRGVYSDSK